MSTVEESIEIAVPVRTAYDQWTQFEEFPRFMEGVEEIRQVDKAGDALGFVRRRAKGDLERFKEMIEAQGPRPAGGAGTSPRRSDAPPTVLRPPGMGFSGGARVSRPRSLSSSTRPRAR